jgi:hypothetical protein
VEVAKWAVGVVGGGVIMVVVVLVVEYRVLCELTVVGCGLTGVSNESDSVASLVSVMRVTELMVDPVGGKVG